MKHLAYVSALWFVCFSWMFAQNSSPGHKISLPSSKVLASPLPGNLGRVNGFPATITLSPDGRYAALLNDGYGTEANGIRQSIVVIDLQTNKLTDFPDDRLGEGARQSYFLGLAFSADGHHLYASIGSISDPAGKLPGDTGNGIAVYRFRQDELVPERFIAIAPQKVPAGSTIPYGLRKTPPGTAIPYPAGLAVISGGSVDKLLVANNLSDNVLLLNSSSGSVLQRFNLNLGNTVPSSYPYTIVAARDGRRAWCSLWNASRIIELNLSSGTISRSIPLLPPDDSMAPGSHPTALLLSPDEKLLYVALANADRVAVISTASGNVMRMLSTAVPGQQAAGTVPNALALSPDGSRLFVADAAINAVAVFDTSAISASASLTGAGQEQALGFIPTDWYPTALAVAGEDLLIATGKGQGTGPNNGPSHGPGKRHRQHPYIATLLYGSVSRVNFHKAERDLPDLTRQVEEDNLFHSDPGRIRFQKGSNPIRHVIYIIKENRTYDQVLADLPVGNGDRSLTMYGADVTPNLHGLALQFGVLDNFYDSGEVSGDGHEWSTAAITSDYNEKTWQISYRGKERTYDYQGEIADENPLDLGVADVDDPSTGYLWDNAAHHGISYRDYGEFIETIWCKAAKGSNSAQEGPPPSQTGVCAQAVVTRGESLPPNVGDPHGSKSPWPWAVPVIKTTKPTKGLLRNHYDQNFPDFELEYPDQLRADEFLNEFKAFVRARTEHRGGELPQLVLLYLPDDHTHGTSPGKPRPAASVADNDLSVGRIVEAVSHSPYWDDTAILVIEDDAQNGADHVDAHRSIAFVISKYSPGSQQHPYVDHRFYTTVNMIHTIEVLLGLPPMNQNDAYAPVIAPLFSGVGDQPPFAADWSNRDNGLLYQTNAKDGEGAKESDKMDFTRPDVNDADVLNAILWRDRMGDKSMPAPRHTVFASSH
ncbi:MAG: bifunctional YncE family protein/alkaline phosphatase family protein [Candidatus Korobacteraceae bacterium]